MFKETPPEIWFCTFWWYPLKPEVLFWKGSLPEVITGNCILNSFSSEFLYVQSPGVQILPNHMSLSQNQNPWFYRTSWNCGGDFLAAWLLKFQCLGTEILIKHFIEKMTIPFEEYSNIYICIIWTIWTLWTILITWNIRKRYNEVNKYSQLQIVWKISSQEFHR